jgi:putative lipoprotein
VAYRPWLLGLLVSLAACASREPVPASRPASAPATYVFTCEDDNDDYRFTARVDDARVELELPTRVVVLPRVVAASGTRYSDGSHTFWSRGREAGLETPGRHFRGCFGVPAATPWEEARLRGASFRAVGQEPGWTLEIVPGKWIRFVGDYGQHRVHTPVPPRETDAASGATIYRARTEAHALALTLWNRPCRDVMSGESFEVAVRLEIDGRVLQGCGRHLPAGARRENARQG